MKKAKKLRRKRVKQERSINANCTKKRERKKSGTRTTTISSKRPTRITVCLQKYIANQTIQKSLLRVKNNVQKSRAY